MLRAGNPPVAVVATLHRGFLWRPDRADVTGDTWLFRPEGLAGILRLRATIISQRTGEPVARQGLRTLDIVGGPTLRWHPRNLRLRPDPPRYVRQDDGMVVATFPRFNVAEVMSGHPRLDLICALVGCRRFVGASTPQPPPSGI